jgi:GT2 family glycosyltransferase
VGGFDPRYFMYWEDVDLCRRLWQEHGLTAAVCPTVVVRHQSGHSQGSEADRFARAARSRDLYLATWGAPWTHRVRARLLGVGKRAYLRSTRS